MNSIQKYVLNSLFVRNQITEEKLAQALGVLHIFYQLLHVKSVSNKVL